MSRSFAERLAAAVRAKGCPLAIGLDPRLDALPLEFGDKPTVAAGIGAFCNEVLTLVADRVPCVKLQSAFFELHGHAGVAAYEQSCSLAKELGLLVIGDVKRGDIGSTAEAYAEAHFRWADALTLQPLLGSDSIAPFLDSCRADNGVFVLVRTCNPSAGEFLGLFGDG
jgi:orotidine-5'-phosphate decarboxylase